mgnify:CR=1 FL=1
MKEVTSHHLGQLNKPDSFCFAVGLVNGNAASKSSKRRLLEVMGLEGDHDINTCIESRFNSMGACAKNDVVLVRRDNSFEAGKVQIHFDVDGEALTLVSMFTLIRHEPARGRAVWRVSSEGAEIIPTSQILDVVIYSHWSADVVCTLLPPDYR